jgi:hypothetical protein
VLCGDGACSGIENLPYMWADDVEHSHEQFKAEANVWDCCCCCCCMLWSYVGLVSMYGMHSLGQCLLQQLGFEEWADDVKHSHEQFKAEAKHEGVWSLWRAWVAGGVHVQHCAG